MGNDVGYIYFLYIHYIASKAEEATAQHLWKVRVGGDGVFFL